MPTHHSTQDGATDRSRLLIWLRLLKLVLSILLLVTGILEAFARLGVT